MVSGWAAHSANAGLAFGKAPGPRQVHALSGYAARDPVTVAGELHAICGRSEGMSVRGRTMARGAAAFRKEETCAVGCTDRGWMPGGDLKSGVRRTRQPRPLAGAAASRAGNGPWGPTPPTHAGPPGAAARGSVETGRDLRAAPAQGADGVGGGAAVRQGVRRQERGEALQYGRDRRRKPVPGAQGGGRRGGEQSRHSGGEREPEPGQGEADSPPDIPFC